jgi:hypothetical protein
MQPALAPLRDLQIRKAGSQAVELGVDGDCVRVRGRIAPDHLADQPQCRRGPTQLVLRPGDALGVHHTASVSL